MRSLRPLMASFSRPCCAARDCTPHRRRRAPRPSRSTRTARSSSALTGGYFLSSPRPRPHVHNLRAPARDYDATGGRTWPVVSLRRRQPVPAARDQPPVPRLRREAPRTHRRHRLRQLRSAINKRHSIHRAREDTAPDPGGAEHFHRFLAEELLPEVKGAIAPIRRRCSWAIASGYFVLWSALKDRTCSGPHRQQSVAGTARGQLFAAPASHRRATVGGVASGAPIRGAGARCREWSARGGAR